MNEKHKYIFLVLVYRLETRVFSSKVHIFFKQHRISTIYIVWSTTQTTRLDYIFHLQNFHFLLFFSFFIFFYLYKFCFLFCQLAILRCILYYIHDLQFASRISAITNLKEYEKITKKKKRKILKFRKKLTNQKRAVHRKKKKRKENQTQINVNTFVCNIHITIFCYGPSSKDIFYVYKYGGV